MKTVKGTLFIVSAPSGAGKTSLVEALIKRTEKTHALERVVTYTSRTPRSTEVQGRDYHFLESCDFEKKIQEGFFLEWSTAYGTYYGSAYTMLEQLKQGVSLIIILDVHGALAVKKLYEQTVLIWIAPLNMHDLQSRLIKRDTDSAEQIQLRLREDSELSNQLRSYYDYTIINDDFNRALSDLISIITQEIQI